MRKPRGKINPELKLKTVKSVMSGEKGLRQAAKEIGVDPGAIRTWRVQYISFGAEGLYRKQENTSYTSEQKYVAVKEYLEGKGSLLDICQKHKIRSAHQLKDWIRQYTIHGEIISHTSGGGSYMKKARETTFEERLTIVTDCLIHDKNYGAIAIKYNCSYQQVRYWVKRYEEMGRSGLEDRRGRRLETQTPRTPEEELKIRIASLEQKNRELQMENDLLKKVRELVKKDRFH